MGGRCAAGRKVMAVTAILNDRESHDFNLGASANG
jgi:hypothetical protein